MNDLLIFYFFISGCPSIAAAAAIHIMFPPCVCSNLKIWLMFIFKELLRKSIDLNYTAIPVYCIVRIGPMCPHVHGSCVSTMCLQKYTNIHIMYSSECSNQLCDDQSIDLCSHYANNINTFNKLNRRQMEMETYNIFQMNKKKYSRAHLCDHMTFIMVFINSVP